MREEANQRIISLAVMDDPSNCAEYFPSIIELAMSPPTHGGRIALLGWVIDKLIVEHFQAAMEGMKKMLVGIKALDFNAQAVKSIAAKWRKTMRGLFRKAGFDERKKLLELSPHLDEDFSRLLVEIASSESFAEMSPVLESFLIDPRLSDRIKGRIRREKYFRERTSGNEGWPELYDLFLPGQSGTPEEEREQ